MNGVQASAASLRVLLVLLLLIRVTLMRKIRTGWTAVAGNPKVASW